ncbi:MAG: DegV family protein [Anaerolineae bacterium]
MSEIIVVTDSTSNLPPDLVAEQNIPVIPLKVHWGDETYIDGVTLKPEQFYRWLQERDDFPTTSQPSAGEFVKFFNSVAEGRSDSITILGIFISSELSGTLLSATQARAMLPELDIRLVDSRSVSLGLGFQVLEAHQAVQEGASIEETIARVQQVRENTTVIFTVDTLEYLHRGGRIGGAARLLGSALNLKPLLAIEGGRVEVLEKIRSRRKALQRMLEVGKEALGVRRPAAAAVLDVDAPEAADQVAAEVAKRLRPRRLYRAWVTPVVGGHAGPGTVGMAFYTLPES